MRLPPPRSTPTDTLVPYTTLFRSVAFDLELQSERILVVAAVRIQAHAAEAAVPLQRRAVGDHAELARHAHAALGIVVVVVVAFVPPRVEADRFALQRADRDRERQRARCAGNVDVAARDAGMAGEESRSEEHTSELQSLM